MESLVGLLNTLNSLSPLAIIGLLGLTIFLLVKGKGEVAGKVSNITDNHLHHMPEILETLQRIEVKLSEDFAYLKARINGAPRV